MSLVNLFPTFVCTLDPRNGELNHYPEKMESLFKAAFSQREGEYLDAEKRKLITYQIELYQGSSDQKIKKGVLTYLFHYRQFNAHYAEAESARLGYPLPLYAQQKRPGYFRTQASLIVELVEPWIKGALYPQLKKSHRIGNINCQKFFNLTGESASVLLKALGSTSSLIECEDLALLNLFFQETIQRTALYLSLLEDLKSLKKEASRALNQIGRTHHKQLILFLTERISQFTLYCDTFTNEERIFFLKFPLFQFSLCWKGGIDRSKKNIQWILIQMEQEMGLISLAGGVADRLNVISWVSESLVQASFEMSCESEANLVQDAFCLHRKLAEFESQNDAGISLYKRFILKWFDNSFSTSFMDFAKPLLSILIGEPQEPRFPLYPIVPLAKIGQHVSELMLFFLECFPEIRKDYAVQQIASKMLNLPTPYLAEVTLFPYGMSAFFGAVHGLSSDGVKRSVCCVSQNYFEVLTLMQAHTGFDYSASPSLSAVQETPDVLIVDIHPNNAAEDDLHENDVVSWTLERLAKRELEKKLILILDITLNHFSDSVIQNLLSQFLPFIHEGRIDLFFVQSLAKLVQLGTDNFSGGLLVHIGMCGSAVAPPKKEVSAKEALFSLLLSEFSPLAKEYFDLVRSNTDFMYKALFKNFNEINASLGFLAMGLTTNVDRGAVYIALHFSSYFEKVSKGATVYERRNVARRIREILYETAIIRKLPITSRQSFGFPLSNLSDVSDAIRFSIGIETPNGLNEYVRLIADFNYALSLYVLEKMQKKDSDSLEAFFALWIRSHHVIMQGAEMKFSHVLLKDEDSLSDVVSEVSYDGNHFVPVDIENEEEIDAPLQESSAVDDVKGNDIDHVSIVFRNKKVCIEVENDERTLLANCEGVNQIWMTDPTMFYYCCDWTESNLLKLYIHLSLTPQESLLVRHRYFNRFLILVNFERNRNPFLDSDNDEDGEFKSEPTFTFLPHFSLCYERQKWDEDNVYFIDPLFGTKPVSLSRIVKDTQRNTLFNKCIRHECRIVPYSEVAGAALVQFLEEKPSLDYYEKIYSFFKNRKKEKGFEDMIDYLNTQDISLMPPPHNRSWSNNLGSVQALREALFQLGSALRAHLQSKNKMDQLEFFLNKSQSITDFDLRESLVTGLSEGYVDD